jgi:hypothetical protein
MAFNWKEFISLADYLKTQTLSGDLRESANRTAVSRIYFAAHHLAAQYAQKSKKPLILMHKGADHWAVINYFNDYTKIQKVAIYLKDLYK